MPVIRKQSRTLAAFVVATLLSLTAYASDKPVTSQLEDEAAALMPLVTSSVARNFLDAVPSLPEPADSFEIYVRKEDRSVVSPEAFGRLDDSSQAGYEKRTLSPEFYYYTRYGTPLAFVRPLDLIANAGLSTLDDKRIIDFGFGSIGQLYLMAANGADAYGIDVDRTLDILYNQYAPSVTLDGGARVLIGSFPSDTSITNALESGYDLFVSKNTLKRGYIHPEREVNPRLLVHLGVDDSTFVQTVYDLLNPGGLFMIYNLHPQVSADDEPYKPWADGRCPFDRELLERIGFAVLSYDTDDTEFARHMGTVLGWAEQMDLTTDLFGTYTLLRKK